MADNAPEQPERQSAISEPELLESPRPPMPPAPPTAPLPWAPAPPPRRGRRALIVGAAVAVLLAAGGVTWWALADDGDAMDHVSITGGKLVTDKSDDSDSYDDEDCDDTDEYSYNDCDAYEDDSDDTTYEFKYKITNKGDEPANYSVIVNAFDADGEYIGQTYIGSVHLAAGKSDSDSSEFNDYDTMEDDHELSDIAAVKVAYVERTALAN